MKTFTFKSPCIRGRRRAVAAALLASSLGLATVLAQSSAGSPSTSTGSGNTQKSTTDRARTSSDRSTNTNAGAGTESPGRIYDSADTRNQTDQTRAASTSGSLKRSDRRFITKVAESSQKEAAIAQLAAQRATRPDVRSFAQELISDHQQMNSQLMQIAQRKGVTLESMGMDMAHNMAGMDASRNAGIATDNGAPRATGAAGTSNTGASTGVTPNASTSTSGTMSTTGASSLPADITSDRQYRRLAKATGEEFDHEYVDTMVDMHERDVQMFQKAAKNAQDPDVRSFASTHLPKLQAHLDRANSLMRSAAE